MGSNDSQPGWTGATATEAMEANRLNWDERAPVHARSDDYALDSFADPDHISDVVRFDKDHLDVAGKRLVHLQCHIGHDTLSWARLGAEVTGLDQSAASIEVARDLGAQHSISGDFVVANLYDARAALVGDFDIVYTGVGALNWLPDISAWARVVADLLRPGGRLYVRDSHPMVNTLVADDDGHLHPVLPYFETTEPMRFETPDTYTEIGRGAIVEHQQIFEWNHGMAEILSAVRDAGLVVDDLREHDVGEWPQCSNMEFDGRWYRMPERYRPIVPLMFTLTATRA